LTTRRCTFDGFEVDSTHLLAVAATVAPIVDGDDDPTSRGPIPIADLSGVKLGNFVIEGLLGRGGMATVWSAVHQNLGSFVAIKILAPHITDTDEAQARFFREAKVSAQLAHAHVVKVIDFARDPNIGAYIVMERLSGDPLDRLLAETGPLPEERATSIALQIADALGAAHDLGIVHRDVKPANVFVTRSLGRDFVKVVDFGIAKLSLDRATALTRSGKLFGTPLYMSPEQWDDSEVGPASDIYSLGVVLYEMMTGRLPLSGSAMIEMAKQVALTQPRSMRVHRPELSSDIDAIVLRCLRKEPGERFASMAELTARLREAQGAYGVSLRGGRHERSTRRVAVLLTVGAVAVAALLAVGSPWTRRPSGNAQLSPAIIPAAEPLEPPNMAPAPASGPAKTPDPAPSVSAALAPSTPVTATVAAPRKPRFSPRSPVPTPGDVGPKTPPAEKLDEEDVLRKR
jgi:serine/threonine-protein kinase